MDGDANFTFGHNVANPPVQFVPTRNEKFHRILEERAKIHSIEHCDRGRSPGGMEALDLTGAAQLAPADNDKEESTGNCVSDAKSSCEKAKRRRTRSGCYTCRSRRVKVRTGSLEDFL